MRKPGTAVDAINAARNVRRVCIINSVVLERAEKRGACSKANSPKLKESEQVSEDKLQPDLSTSRVIILVRR